MTDIVDAEIVNDEEESTKIRPTRALIKFAATHSVRFVVSAAVTSLVPVESKWDKRRVLIGSYVIAGLINEKTKPFVDEEIDDALEFIREVRIQVKKQIASEKNSETSNP